MFYNVKRTDNPELAGVKENGERIIIILTPEGQEKLDKDYNLKSKGIKISSNHTLNIFDNGIIAIYELRFNVDDMKYEDVEVYRFENEELDDIKIFIKANANI